MADYILGFDLTAFEQLDQFALLACQEYNLGNHTNWFGTFRGGLYGFYSRIHGVVVNYHLVHSWIPRLRSPTETEYYVTSVLFNMDSALECLVFAFNALGCAAAPTSFHDVTTRKGLNKISPRDILGVPEATPPREPLQGYSQIYKATQDHWVGQRDLVKTICELHDVSKHRQVIYEGGMARLDPPIGFYEALGVAGDRSKEALFWPFAEIILRHDPKAPLAGHVPAELEEYPTFERLAERFVRFINGMGLLALADAKSKITLPHNEFQALS